MIRHFLRDTRGAIAPLLALTLLPLTAAVGVAVDFSRINAARTTMQTALDSTALMLSKNAATQTSSELQTSANTYFNALLTSKNLTQPTVAATYTTVPGSKIVLNATATVKTDIMNIFGYDQVTIKATSTSEWGNTRLRVALVLDNTGSMSSDGKMDALKTASQNLLTQLKKAASDPEDVYVSIVPFNKDVNLNAANYAESWLRWDLWEAENGSCSGYSSWKKPKTQSSCLANGGTWTPNDHSTWNGCVTDRDQNFDTTNDAPLAGATLYPAEQYSSCPESTMGLSNDWTLLDAKITAMQPKGNTNQAIGLQLGWQTLTQSPYTVPAEDPNYNYSKVIILLTDGLNTENRWYSSSSLIDAREQTTCDNIKAAGITVYAVQVNTGGDPTSTLLQSCASNSSKFFLLTTANELIATFDQIGTALTNLRLAM
jgi:Flp pilus assembly protein TadG